MAAWHMSFLVVGRVMLQPLPCPSSGSSYAPTLALCVLSLVLSTLRLHRSGRGQGSEPPSGVGLGKRWRGHTWVLMWVTRGQAAGSG